MADTIRTCCPDEECSDCGTKGTVIKHWGLLVRPGEVGNFCAECWAIRDKSGKINENAEPLGCRKKPAEAKV
jgi:hypothetical protein